MNDFANENPVKVEELEKLFKEWKAGLPQF